jgi:uncharacterized protein
MMKGWTLTCLLVLYLTTHLLAQLAEDITIETATGDLAGTLLIPPGVKKPPIAIIIAGSGPTDRDGNNPRMKNNSLKMLATDLTEKGIATLRYDKRGVAKSKSAGLKEADLRFETYIEDASAWVDKLKNDGRFSRIIIIGHSEGSLIGMIASQQENVDKFVSIAGVGRPVGEILREQLSAQPPIVLETAEPILQKLERGELVEEVPVGLYSLFRPSVQPYMISWLKYNPQEEIAKLNKPVLLIQGTTDIQVKLLDVENLAKANPKVEKRVFEGMNHVLKEAELDRTKNIETYSNPDLPLMTGLVNVIISFID